MVVCYPDQLPQFIGDRTRVVAVSTHNPLGTTFAAGVYASIFGSSREPINALYARRMFDVIRTCRRDHPFSIVLGGSGAWQIEETGTESEFGIDTIVTGRAESREVIDLFRRALDGEALPRRIDAQQQAAAVARRDPAPCRKGALGGLDRTADIGGVAAMLERLALIDPKTQASIAGKQVVKVIVVPDKLVNIVVR